MRSAAIVVAAGRGERFGGDVPKALVPVAGRPLVVHAVEELTAAGIAEVVVVHPPGAAAAFFALLSGAGLPDDPPVTLVPGGAQRSDSVRAGLAAVSDAAQVVAVHDAARGLQPAAVIASAVAAVGGEVVAAAPALPLTDTVKRVVGPDVVGTLDRDAHVGVQTPQVVVATLLRDAHTVGVDATDDLAVVERHLAAGLGPPGARVVHVAGAALGRKVTYAEDVAAIEALLAAR